MATICLVGGMAANGAPLRMQALFFLFPYIGAIFTLLILVASVSAVCFAAEPVVRRVQGTSWGLRLTRVQAWRNTLAALPGLLVVIPWLCTGSWVLNNIIGASLVVAFVSYIKLPNIRVAALLLGGLFAYDV